MLLANPSILWCYVLVRLFQFLLTKIRPFPGNATIDDSLAPFSFLLNGRDLMINMNIKQ